MLHISHVSKKFRKKEVLHDINLCLKSGVYGLLGENGAGKSTLMRCIMGLYPDYQGEIIWENAIDGKKVDIGYLPQNFDGLGELKVYELLKYFSDIKGMKKQETMLEIDRVLAAVNLSDKKNARFSSLSGGMRRRIGIAQTLLGNPAILIYDEPTTGLDPRERIRFENTVEEQKSGKCIVISTHIVSDIECLCDKIIVMKEGNVLGVFTPAELAQVAEGKVFEVKEEEYNRNKDAFMLVKKILVKSGFVIRVMSDTYICGKNVESTMEDGYLWVSK